MKTADRNVYWDTVSHGSWTFHLAATEKGLCCITLPHEGQSALEQWVQKYLSPRTCIRDPRTLAPYTEQIQEYLEGNRTSFSLALDLKGTSFQIQVWQALQEIPYATLRSYTEIAATIGRPMATRAVGRAIGSNPIPLVLPCHRVVGKDGTLTGYRGGLPMKAALLKHEGIAFMPQGILQNDHRRLRESAVAACKTTNSKASLAYREGVTSTVKRMAGSPSPG